MLVVANKTAATPSLVEAVKERAAAGPAEFVLLLPNPDHLAFDRVSHESREGEHLLADALPESEIAPLKATVPPEWFATWTLCPAAAAEIEIMPA